MKRLVLIAIAWLLVGVAVNTAVAWGCALWVPLSPPWIRMNGKQEIECIRGFGCEYEISHPIWNSADSGLPFRAPSLQVRAGWPIATWVCADAALPLRADAPFWSPASAAPVPATSAPAIQRGVPLQPDIFALSLMSLPFLAWPVGLFVVRVRRWPSGRCVTCGYQAAPLPVCPECGTPTDDSRERHRPATATRVDPTTSG